MRKYILGSLAAIAAAMIFSGVTAAAPPVDVFFERTLDAGTVGDQNDFIGNDSNVIKDTGQMWATTALGDAPGLGNAVVAKVWAGDLPPGKRKSGQTDFKLVDAGDGGSVIIQIATQTAAMTATAPGGASGLGNLVGGAGTWFGDPDNPFPATAHAI